MLKISVVTPSYNQEAFIRTTIESVLSQTYPHVEYLVMDGGSEDGTLEVLKSYGSRFYWESKPDRGQTNAINKGWKKSTGEILAWLNSDDFYYPESLQLVASFFEKNPHIDWVYGDCNFVDEQGNLLRAYPTRPYNYLDLLVNTWNYIPQPATFIRRRVFESCGFLDESLNYIMDMEYWLRIGERFQGGYLPAPLAALRLHREAKSLRYLSGFARELVQVYQGYFSRNDLPENIRKVKRKALYNAYLHAADTAFWGRDIQSARSYAWKGFLLYPYRPRKIFGWLLLGQFGRVLVEKFSRNPYIR